MEKIMAQAWRGRSLAVGSVVGATLMACQTPFAFAHDFVLGTSLDIRLTAVDQAAADAAHSAALGEIDRLEKILSAYIPEGQLARVNAGETLAVSPELLDVLTLYDAWRSATGGAISPSVATLKKLWREAATTGIEPDAARLAAAIAEAQSAAWRTTDAGELTADAPLNIDALGKAYVAQRAATAARNTPGISGGVLDIGGDLVTWGSDVAGRPWRVGIADPMNPADNAAPHSVIDVHDAAIATSGSYARGSLVAGEWRSHIINPKTGRPAPEIVSATVVADDLVSANALATAMNVGAAAAARELAARFGGVSTLVINRRGRAASTGMFVVATAPTSAPASAPAKDAAAKWPAGYQVAIGVDLAVRNARRPERPITAIWIEDANGKLVRTIEVWGGIGKDYKYLRDLRTWWKWGQADADMVRAVTRASRNPGQYSIAWDGTDQKGNAVAPGTYTVWIEAASEHGGKGAGSGKIVCGSDKSTGKIDATASFNAATLTYAPKEKAK
jgi:FAD:protein FMN transferase